MKKTSMFLHIVYTTILIGLFLYTVSKKWRITEQFDTYSYNLYNTNTNNIITDTNTPLTSHNVDMPINTTYSCNNFCGPNSQCAITREQCTSDVDCYGCQPIPTKPPEYLTKNVRGDNDAGNLVYNQNPRYSTLTTDIGTQASLYGNKNARVPQMYLGVDRWMESANYALQLRNNELSYQYSSDPEEYKFIPHYPYSQSITGLFTDIGPLASNAYL